MHAQAKPDPLGVLCPPIGWITPTVNMAPRRSCITGRKANAAQRLPPELLMECLRAADLPTRLRASHVSRVWHAIALSDRRLWDSFSCSQFRDIPHQDVMFEKLQAMLVRSRSLPFRLCIPYRYHGTAVRYRLRVLCLEQLDVRRIASYTGPWPIISALIVDQTPLPKLASFSVFEPNPEWDNALMKFGRALSGHMFPNLETLQLNLVRFTPGGCPFPAVRSLTCSLEDDFNLERLFHVFPNVVRLQINDVEPIIPFPPVSLPATLRTIVLYPYAKCEIYLHWTLQNWPGARLPHLVAYESGTAHGVLPLFLAMHPHPIELRLNGLSGEVELCALADEFKWSITPSQKSLPTFLHTLELHTSERLTSISVALDQLDRLFAAGLHIPGLQRLELQLDGLQELPRVRAGDEGYYMSAPRLQRLAFSIDGQADASHARIDEIQSLLFTLSGAFRGLISYDADLLESITLSAPAACVEKLKMTDFVRLTKAYLV